MRKVFGSCYLQSNLLNLQHEVLKTSFGYKYLWLISPISKPKYHPSSINSTTCWNKEQVRNDTSNQSFSVSRDWGGLKCTCSAFQEPSTGPLEELKQEAKMKTMDYMLLFSTRDASLLTTKITLASFLFVLSGSPRQIYRDII